MEKIRFKVKEKEDRCRAVMVYEVPDRLSAVGLHVIPIDLQYGPLISELALFPYYLAGLARRIRHGFSTDPCW